jgi:hypothetical protein
MWKLREGITEGLLHDGYVFKYDISLPHNSFYAIIPELRTCLPAEKVGRICGYGHVGRFLAAMGDPHPCDRPVSLYFQIHIKFYFAAFIFAFTWDFT